MNQKIAMNDVELIKTSSGLCEFDELILPSKHFFEAPSSRSTLRIEMKHIDRDDAGMMVNTIGLCAEQQ